MWKQKPLAEISLGEAGDLVASALLTSRSLDGNEPPCSAGLKCWTSAPSLQCLDMQKAKLTANTDQLHFSLTQAALVPTEGMRDHREHPPGCSALSYSTGCLESWRRELTIRKVKEQVPNLLSSSPDSQLLPKNRSLARKGKTRNWAQNKTFENKRILKETKAIIDTENKCI